MVDITQSNFEEMWPAIKKNIDEAVLIGIDSEFSGIISTAKIAYSLFDSMSERYTIQRQNISPFTVTQFGLTAFVRSRESPNNFVAHPYNFFLCPPSFGRLDPCFSCQSSSLQFLRRYNFDFNKFIHDGIPFLHEEDEAILREDVRDVMCYSKYRANVDEQFLQESCSSVSRWLTSAADPEPVWSLDVADSSLRYLLQKEIRQRFPDAWTSSRGKKVLVTRVTSAVRRDLEATDDLDERFTSAMVGFSRVIRHVSSAQKPVVGHNCLLDLMFIHNLFIAPLPKDYNQFKSTIHRWFPEVYDTKNIGHAVRGLCSVKVSALVDGGNLAALYQGLSSDSAQTTVLHPPAVRLARTADRYREGVPHEAGFDAFAAGFCCLQMAHLLAHKDAVTSDSHRPLSGRELLNTLSVCRNRINVIRGTVNYLCLDGADPPSERPSWFHLSSKAGQRINIAEVVQLLSQCGSVDVRPYSARQALIAVGNYRCAKDVMHVFRKDKRYTIAKYSVLKHSPVVRAVLWSSVVVSGLGAVLLVSQLRR